MSKPSEPAESISLSKCTVFPTNVVFFNFFVWSKVMVLNLPVKETKMPQTCSLWPPSGLLHSMPAGRRRGNIRQTAYGHQNHGETL